MKSLIDSHFETDVQRYFVSTDATTHYVFVHIYHRSPTLNFVGKKSLATQNRGTTKEFRR